MDSPHATPMSVAMIGAMVTPALLLLGSTAMVSAALIRLARIVDRARLLAEVAHDGAWTRLGIDAGGLRVWLERHGRRARFTARAIEALYVAIVIFIATCLSIPLDAATNGAVAWLPGSLAIAGTLCLLTGGACMVVEARIAGRQVAEEIATALGELAAHQRR